MKKMFYLLMCVCVWIPTLLTAGWRPDEKLVRVRITDPAQWKRVYEQKFEIDRVRGGYLHIYATPDDLQRLRLLGFRPEVLIADLPAYSRSMLQSGLLANYHDYNATRSLVDSLLAQFPDLIRKVSYGQSLQGRELYAVKISDHAQTDEPEPELSFDACHHGDEIMSAEVIVRLMRDLCTEYGTNPQITRLVNTREIWIYPFINPDGRQALTRYNSAGVDVNRDWGYMWDAWGGSPAPFSQPESQAGRQWIEDNQFVISQTGHGGTEAISYPWSYRPDQAPDRNPIDFLAAGYSASSGYSNLSYFQGYNGMYAINGSAKDAFYGLMGSVGWTMEVSNDKMPPSSQISQYYNWNKPAMLYLAEMAGKGIKGMVNDAVTGSPVPAIVWVSDNTRRYWPVYADPQVGDFHKYLLPGTYSVRLTANGYQPLELTNIVVSDSGATAVNGSLQPQTGSYAYRVVYCQIPGNNYADEGFTPAALGAPDSIRYSLGKGGTIVLDMGEAVPDYPGNDFRIIEGDATPESYTVLISNSWNGPWIPLGMGTGTQDFDASAAGVAEFRYIRLEDDGDGPATAADAGFDLDAVKARLIPDSGPFVTAAGYLIDDSLSNNNGVLEAGETVRLSLLLHNLGVDDAHGVGATITSGDSLLRVLSDSAYLGTLASGGTGTIGPFEISADSTVPDGARLALQVQITATGGFSWNQALHLLVREGARLTVDPRQIDFQPTFVNFTRQQALDIHNTGHDSLHITRFESGDSVFRASESELHLAPGARQTVPVIFQPGDTLLYRDTLRIYSNDPRQLVYLIPLSGRGILAPDIAVSPDSLAVQMLPDDSLTLSLTIFNQGAGPLVFTAQIGPYQPDAGTESAGGNDSFGHIWIDSDEPGGPPFNWIELSGGGVQLPLSGLNSTSDPIPLNFTVPFYADSFNTLRICSNGWISYTTFSVSYNNTNLPNNLAPRAMIAPLWDNLNMQSDSRIFYQHESDYFVVEWQNLYTATGHGPYSFETILYRNGSILLQYKSLVNPEDSYTVGMQNNAATDGFTIAYNQAYLHDEMAILISRQSWAGVSPRGGELAPGEQLNLAVTLKTENFPLGDFFASVEIHSNDPDEALITIPIHLRVDSVTAIAGFPGNLPAKFELAPNYPNPFNPATRIRFQLPEPAGVHLTVLNIRGQVVRRLLRKKMSAGYHSVVWDGRDESGTPVASGMYLYRLRAGSFRQTRKMILLK